MSEKKLVEVAVRVVGEQNWRRKVGTEVAVHKWLDRLAEKVGGYEALDIRTAEDVR